MTVGQKTKKKFKVKKIPKKLKIFSLKVHKENHIEGLN